MKYLFTSTIIVVSLVVNVWAEARDVESEVFESFRMQAVDIIAQFYPDAELEGTEWSFQARRNTMVFTVHGVMMTGEVNQHTHEEEGPTHNGFILSMRLEDAASPLQPVVPQTLKRPYWVTFFNSFNILNSGYRISLSLSYGSRTDREFVSMIESIVPNQGMEPTPESRVGLLNGN